MDTILFIMLELKKKYKFGSALEILQEAILCGDIPEEIIITQNELASSMGISRMPVREALIALEYQGLVEKLPSQHARLVKIDDDFMRGIFADLALIELETLKDLSAEKISELSDCKEQIKFHRLLRKQISSSFRRKILEILTEIYLAFVLANSENTERIEVVFRDLRASLKCPEVRRAGYAVYSEVLANELMLIRKEKINAQS